MEPLQSSTVAVLIQLPQDEARLPEGMERMGYDADTQTYSYRDQDGSYWEGDPGARYGELHPSKRFMFNAKEKEAKEKEVEEKRVKERGVKERGVKERGVKERGVKERGVKKRGIKERGVEEKGIKEKGVSEVEEPRDSYT
ncbi:hypothetical protein BP6252_13784 [Coleophoma cylindrospora]|uniref:Uncharacterized protein n=1 Tax=Coleophoma cylindrospora TaxID=1849047 RepID=A0A3D8Q6I6_9HELO|nr:hypothetical protein BP6252_13784 [Coleophoma cylindrospora]